MLCSVPGDNPGRKTSFHLGEDFECWRGGCPKCSKASLLSTFRSGPAASVWSCISGHPFSSPSPQHTLALSPSLKATHVDHGHHRQSNQVTAEHLCLHCSLNTALLYKRSKVITYSPGICGAPTVCQVRGGPSAVPLCSLVTAPHSHGRLYCHVAGIYWWPGLLCSFFKGDNTAGPSRATKRSKEILPQRFHLVV